jgi:diaminopimelate decarboxylase
VPQDVVGPLCFSGDIVAAARPLPLIEPGDHVLVHDTGAYTLGMWSRYNSRLSPPVLAYNAADPGSLELLRAGESIEDVLAFWD